MIWRIRERSVFARLSQDGLRARAGVLWCIFLPDPSASPPRVAFAIGRAVGPAVIRNQVRRRLRALLGNLPSDRSLPAGWYLVGARPAAAERSFAQLSSDVEALIASVEASAHRRPSSTTRSSTQNTRSPSTTTSPPTSPPTSPTAGPTGPPT